MSTKGRRRAVVLVVLFAMACSGLASLGVWQLSRATEKRERHAVYRERHAAPVVAFDDLDPAANPVDQHWRRFELRGHYRELDVLLDNRVRNAVAGYEVLTPFVTTGGHTVVINRGWVPMPGSRTAVPDVLAPADPFVLRAYAAPPPATGVAMSAAAHASEWLAPRVVRIQHVDFGQLAGLVEATPFPTLFYLEDAAPGALDTAWPVPGDGAARHTAYAVQWFSMAVVLAFIGLWNWRRSARNDV